MWDGLFGVGCADLVFPWRFGVLVVGVGGFVFIFVCVFVLVFVSKAPGFVCRFGGQE